MGRDHRPRVRTVTVGDKVYLAGVSHIAANEGTVSRFWSNGWVEVRFPGWTWVGDTAEVERREGTAHT